jgi:hypothetical protein
MSEDIYNKISSVKPGEKDETVQTKEELLAALQ